MAAERRLAAIVFTDIVGYTALAQADEAAALRLVQEQERLAEALLQIHHGRKVKATGDGLLLEFPDALDAVECAVDLQRHVHDRNAREGPPPLHLRVGIHLGDVRGVGTDILGDAVNVASRIEPLAEPGGVCLTEPVYTLVRNKVSSKMERLGPKNLKGVQEPVGIYRVVFPWTREETPEFRSPTIPRIAVLPLANISPDPKDEYFADGLTEELISALSRIHELRVIARTSVNLYRSIPKSISQIGVELGVTSVLEGSVRKAGNRLRISLQLIDASTQEHRWANVYDRELDDVFAIQTEVAERTAGALRLELLGLERESIRKERTTNFAAYELYLRGIHALHQAVLTEGYREAIRFFEEAVRNEPGFSQAYAQLAYTSISLAGDALPRGESFSRARELVAKALELNPNSSEAHTARGMLALHSDHDYAVAGAEFKRAISLNPSSSVAHREYAILLTAINRFDDAVRELRTTIELDPLWEHARTNLSRIACFTGDYTLAVASAEEERDRQPEDPWSHICLGLVYVAAGRMADARREAELSAGSVNKRGEWGKWNLAVLWTQVGKPEEARRLLRQLVQAARTKHVNRTWIAAVYASLGERAEAFEWLERDHGEGVDDLVLWHSLSAFDPIRDDPRFVAMLRSLNLPTTLVRPNGSPRRGLPN